VVDEDGPDVSAEAEGDERIGRAKEIEAKEGDVGHRCARLKLPSARLAAEQPIAMMLHIKNVTVRSRRYFILA
jgi:hypothetical protein